MWVAFEALWQETVETGNASLMISAVLGAAIWVITTPLRNVSWVFFANMSEGVQAVYFFGITCGDRYLSAARSEEALALPPPEYACALASFLFLIPIAVLRDYEAKFGIVGRLSLKWCEAFHHTCCLFVPDAVQLLWSAGGRYARATGEAVVAAGERTGDFVVGLYVLLSLLVACAIYLPRVLYETVVGILLGWRGVTLVLVVWNAYLEFGVECYFWNGLVMALGCYSHLARCYERRYSTRTVRPSQVAGSGWRGQSERIGRREERERLSVERLRGPSAIPSDKAVSSMQEATTPGDVPPAPTPDGDSVVRPTPKEKARRGRRATVGENCHGPQLDGGLALMVDCIHKFCLLQSQRAPSDQLGPDVPASECQV